MHRAARLPWARFLVTLRYIVEHANSLRWVPYQTRSREMIHLFTPLCDRYLADLPGSSGADGPAPDELRGRSRRMVQIP